MWKHGDLLRIALSIYGRSIDSPRRGNQRGKGSLGERAFGCGLSPSRGREPASRATFAPEASLKIDAIESGYAVPLVRLKLHVWCIDLSIRPGVPSRSEGACRASRKHQSCRFKEPT